MVMIAYADFKIESLAYFSKKMPNHVRWVLQQIKSRIERLNALFRPVMHYNCSAHHEGTNMTEEASNISSDTAAVSVWKFPNTYRGSRNATFPI